MTSALTTTETADLRRLEKTIERGVKTFVSVGSALAEIKERKLYRERAGTFQDYCQQVWGFTGQRAYQLIKATQVESQLAETSTTDDAPNLPTERHARELARLPEDQRADCLADARQKYGDDLSAAQLGEVVDLWLADNEPYEEPEPTETSTTVDIPRDEEPDDEPQPPATPAPGFGTTCRARLVLSLQGWEADGDDLTAHHAAADVLLDVAESLRQHPETALSIVATLLIEWSYAFEEGSLA